MKKKYISMVLMAALAAGHCQDVAIKVPGPAGIKIPAHKKTVLEAARVVTMLQQKAKLLMFIAGMMSL